MTKIVLIKLDSLIQIPYSTDIHPCTVILSQCKKGGKKPTVFVWNGKTLDDGTPVYREDPLGAGFNFNL